MFAEKLDAAQAAAPLAVRAFPNLRARQTFRTVIDGIVETCNHVRMTEAEQTAFALGCVRGAIAVLRTECDDEDVPFSALPQLLETLDRFSQYGLPAIRTIAENVAGQDLATAEAAKVLDLPLAPFADRHGVLPDSGDPGDSVTREFNGKDSFAGSFASDAESLPVIDHRGPVYRGPCRDCGSVYHSEHPRSAN